MMLCSLGAIVNAESVHGSEFSVQRNRIPICGPKWPKKHSPGFYPVNSPTGMSPEGVGKYGVNRLRTSELDRVRISSPFRAKRLILG
jgi:hypothetical protein